MKTHRLLICTALLFLPALARAQDQSGEPDAFTGVASSGTVETSGAVPAKAAADFPLAASGQIDLSLGFDVEGKGGGASSSLQGEQDAPATMDAALVVLDGDNQTALAGSFNANPFDIAVWHGSGSMPLVGQPVTLTVEQGGGLLSETTVVGSGSSSITLASDEDGTVQAYYRQGTVSGVLSSIRVDAAGKNLTLQSLSSGSSAIAGDFGKSPVQQATGSSATMGIMATSAMLGASMAGANGDDSGKMWVPCDDCGGTGWIHGRGESDWIPCPYCDHGMVEVDVLAGFAAWALAHGYNPNTPYADSNGDGICDLEEYLMEMNPNISGDPIAGFEIFSPGK